MDIKELKLNLPRGKTIMAFDYGEKRLGVASSDLLLMTANPIKIIQRRTLKHDIAEIRRLAEEKETGAFVYGLPLQMDGTEGSTAAAVRKFAAAVATEIDLPYLFWDERLSSKAVENFLIKEIDMSRAKRRQQLDAAAAAYILQGVLDSLRYL